MPSISKIRFTNIIYEDGNKRYNDEVFLFDGHNSAILLENGGGKTVFIQTALQAILPHTDLADRKIKDTLKLEDAPAHIAIEWILNDHPRRYALTCVSLFLTKTGLDSYRYVFEYGDRDKHSIEQIPFVKEYGNRVRATDRGDIQEYYSTMSQNHMQAKTFDTLKSYKKYVEENFHIIPKEWESIIKINSAEGGVEHFFDECKTTGQLFDRLLIPTVEESMTGFQKDVFASTFEKHRDSFKKYKQLKEKIAEYERVKDRVAKYAFTFERLDEKTRTYEVAKEQTKAYMLLAQKHQELGNHEQEKLHSAFQDLKEKQALLAKKETSYEIAVDQEQLNDLSVQLTEETEKLETHTAQFKEIESTYYSAKLADYKKKLTIETQQKKMLEEKLLQVDKDVDTEEIRDMLLETEQKIKGHFLTLEENYNKKAQQLTYEKNSISTSLQNEKNDLITLELEEKRLQEQETKNKTIIIINEQEMKEIQTLTLSNPNQETVEEQLKIWTQQSNDMDNENMTLIQKIKQLGNESQFIETQLEESRSHLNDLIDREAQLKSKKRNFDSAHSSMKEKLTLRKTAWSRIDSLYLKQDSFAQQVNEDVTRLTETRESLLIQERLASRFFDDYGNQDVFYADPFLSQQLKQWKSQFTYLETGVSYISSLDQADGHITGSYPFWPLTLITTTREKDKLVEKVLHIQYQLQYPVTLLTLDEASAIIHEKEPLLANWVLPKHWQANLDIDSFAHWKETMQDAAEQAKENRMNKEAEWHAWLQLQKDIDDFFTQYPFADYQELLDDELQLQDEMFQLKNTINKFSQRLLNIKKDVKTHEDKLAWNKEAMYGYGQKIEKAYKYVKLKKDNIALADEIFYVDEKLVKTRHSISKAKKNVLDLQEQVEKLNLDIGNLNSRLISEVQENRLFKLVMHLDAVYSDMSIENLEENRHQLLMDLEKLSRGRSELESAIQSAKKNAEYAENDIEQLRKEHNDLIEDMDIQLFGKDKMDDLWAQRNHVLQLKNEVNDSVTKLNNRRLKLEGAINSKKEKIDSLIYFNEHLHAVRKLLDEELREMDLEKAHLLQTSQQLEVRLQDINKTISELEKYDVKHLFFGNSIKESILSAEEVNDFEYARLKKAETLIQKLEESFSSKNKEEKIVEQAKHQYIHFCRNEISDVRMRETAVQGIGNKHSYEDVLKHKEMMERTIHTAIKYAEQNIILHDKELEQFIIHVHAHIKKIADELKILPKKTSVQVDDQWKEIFTFNIPDWNENDGKASIRAHINWILEQLDKDTYKDANDQDDSSKMKKDLEKWLHSKQLLQVVMQNQSMKVTCRKVTNDNKVTRGAYSWEQSNVWSGGEKWSKNMTLFLGLLNYIAEKRQHIQPKSKRHRTVMVDNPFGKASSDHVLSPVFFIAEQLGFQIIALTAHAEGKFLRDYFPIIYSCRLRNAANSDKQIMTKEKTIQHAYFQDHEPRSLERLGEAEQLELF